MTEKKLYSIQLDSEIKAALDKHQNVSGSRSYKDAIANLLGIDTPQSKIKKTTGVYKEHSGPTAAIIDAAILRCWEHEATRWQEQKAYFRGNHAVVSSIDKTRAEIINAVKEAMGKTYPNETTWMSLYPLWFKESLEAYVDNRLQALKAKGFIDNSNVYTRTSALDSAGVWTMISNVIETKEWDLLRLVCEEIKPHKQLNIPDLLRPRE